MYIQNRREHEQRIVNWLESIAPTARRLIMLGDVMDYWWDYRTVVPRGYVRFLGTLARMADSGVEIWWFKGNHDIWLFDYMQSEIGVKVIDGQMITDIDGKRFFLEHGDGVGQRPLSFRILRRLFRCHTAQIAYSAIHPRWTIPLANAWSRHSRMTPATPNSDIDVCAPLIDFAKDYLSRNQTIDYFIFGHVHRALDIELQKGKKVVVLGDWITKFTYAVFDGTSLSLNTYTPD